MATRPIAIFSALTRGSVFPRGPYDLVFWFAGEPVPSGAAERPGRPCHAVGVPEGWDPEGDGTGHLGLTDGEEWLDAWEALMTVLVDHRDGFDYLPHRPECEADSPC